MTGSALNATAPDNQASRRLVWATLAAIIIIAAGLRVYGLWWAFPHRLHCDENKLIGVTVRLAEGFLAKGSLDPQFSAYGALPMYLALALAPAARGLGAVAGQRYDDHDAVLLAGRALSALADTLSVLLVFLLGRLHSVRAGLWGAALYAVALVGVREAHFFSPDPLATCLVLLYVYLAGLVLTAPSRRRYALAGFALGLALSVKLTALPLVLLGLVAFGMQVGQAVRRGGDPKLYAMATRARRLRAGVLALGGLAVVPAAAWALLGHRIRQAANDALVWRVDRGRVEAHSTEFWQDQVESIYRGGLEVLATVAVVGVVGSMFVLFLLTGHRGPRRSYEAYRRLNLLAAFLGATLLTFVVLNPSCVLRPFNYWAPAGPDHLTWNILMVNGALNPPPGWALHFAGTHAGWYQLRHVLPYAWGVPLMAALLPALVWGLWALVRREGGREWVVILATLVMALLVGRTWVKMTRYVLPLTPLLCAVAGMMVARWTQSPGRVTAWTGRVLAGAVVALSLAWCVGYVSIYGGPDNRVAALAWLAENVRPGERLLYEKDDAWGAAGEYAIRTAGPHETRRLHPLAYMHDFFGRPLRAEAVDAKWAYLRTTTRSADLLLLTDTNFSRLRLVAESFPAMHEFYQQLFAGRTQFWQVASFEAGPTFLGRPVDDSRAEPSFRLFDHPKVYVFRATETAPRSHAADGEGP